MFGINQVYPGYDSYDVDMMSETDISIVDVSTDDTVLVEDNIEEAITATQETIEKAGISNVLKSNLRSGKKNKVVVLDPGHGGSDGGAAANGLVEKDLTLKIAQYCKAELEKYSGITVYMTRNEDRDVGVSERVKMAKNWGADVMVSIHINSASPSANGAEVWYPNSSYNANIHTEGKELASDIQKELTSLGLTNRGIKIRNSENGTTYVDGSIADYYGIIRDSKNYGFPGIIVEHAFITNTSDAEKLRQESFLKKLGTADASGIAKYFDLSKAQLSVSKNDFKGTFQIKISGDISDLDEYSAAVWSDTNGQNDIKWYNFKKKDINTAIADVDIRDHQNEEGEYFVHLYCGGQYVSSVYFTIVNSTAIYSVSDLFSNETVFQLKTDINNVPNDLKGINYAVWSEENGQDDIKWYAAERSKNVWTNNVKISDFKKTGTYYIHIYAEYMDGSSLFLGSKSFNVSKPFGVISSSKSGSSGTFNVTISDLAVPSGVDSIVVAAWSKTNQEDIYWYNAEKISSSTYKAKVVMANHNNNTGIYNIHVYLKDNNGITTYLGAIKETMEVPNSAISAINTDGNQQFYNLSTQNLDGYGNIKQVRFGVWSSKNGQDDLIWYDGAKDKEGKWKTNIDISKHHTEGIYNVHVYLTLSDGTQLFLGATTFTVDIPKAVISDSGYNAEKGTIDVTIDNVVTKSALENVSIAVWSKDNQEDIYWYTAKKISENTYHATIKTSNHNYNVGKYQIHGYAQCVNGVNGFLGATSCKVELSNVKVDIKDISGKQTDFTATVSKLGVYNSANSVRLAVWSEKDGQDDLIWYEAEKNSGLYSANISIKNHKTIGKYYVHAYAYLNDERSVFLGATEFEIEKPTAEMSVENLDLEKGTFDVVIRRIESKSGVNQISIPVWSKDSQEDIYWYVAERVSDKIYKTTVYLSNHNYNMGTYKIHGYLSDGNNINSYLGSISENVSIPAAEIKIKDKSGIQTNYEATVKLNETYIAASKIEIAVWSEKDGQDDLKWYNATKEVDSLWKANVSINDFNSTGNYIVHVYVTWANGEYSFLGASNFQVDLVTARITIENVESTTGKFDVIVDDISTKSGISSIQVPVWCSNDQNDIVWYNAERLSNNTYKVSVDVAKHKFHSGTYKVHVYITEKNGITTYIGGRTQQVESALYSIMGQTSGDVVPKLVAYYKANNPVYDKFTKYGSDFDGCMAQGGAPTLESFCQIFAQEAQSEGVKVEVAFAQSMLETGFLKYGGDVKPNQYNFAGLGATGGVPGNRFDNVRQGIRAQIQHLKCYASTDELVNPCVDPRWGNWLRGTAPYVQWLSIPNNPNGTGWAADANYSEKILKGIETILQY